MTISRAIFKGCHVIHVQTFLAQIKQFFDVGLKMKVIHQFDNSIFVCLSPLFIVDCFVKNRVDNRQLSTHTLSKEKIILRKKEASRKLVLYILRNHYKILFLFDCKVNISFHSKGKKVDKIMNI